MRPVLYICKVLKKHRELKNLFNYLEGQFEMYNAGVLPVKATGTRWIYHRIHAIGRVVEKFGLYTKYLKNVFSTSASVQSQVDT